MLLLALVAFLVLLWVVFSAVDAYLRVRVAVAAVFFHYPLSAVYLFYCFTDSLAHSAL